MEISTTLREALQFIAEGASELAGFNVAAISVVDDGVLHTVAAVGDEGARAQLMELRTPVQAVIEELAGAERWGPLWFVPEESMSHRLDGLSWTPDSPPSDAADAWRPADLLCALLYDASGTLRGVLSMDLPRNGRRPGTEQRRILEMFASQAEHAVVNAIERGDFEAGMERERAVADYRQQLIRVLSHDLINTVAAISNTAELLRMEGGLSALQERGLSVIDRGSEMIKELVEDMKVLGQLGDPDYPVRIETVDVSRLVRDVCDLQLVDAKTRDVELLLDVSSGLTVPGEHADLSRMFANLVSNAIKYSDPGGRVTVSLRPGPCVVDFTVADQGIGISAEDRPRLYEEFFRSSDRQVRRRRGHGLGLAIVHRIVVRHGGRISVASAPGEGSTFHVLLPAESTGLAVPATAVGRPA